MNWSGIPKDSLVGKALRLPLKLLPPNMRMPIMRGRLKGKKWIVGSSDHGCWLGSYEYDKQNLFAKTVKPEKVVYDLGGNVGFYSLLASELVGPKGKVFAFEPVPQNIHYLREHLRLNNVENVSVIEAAVSEYSGEISFAEGPDSRTGRIASDGTLKVKAVVLDELVSSGMLLPPDYMKIDIEGAELSALRGSKSILRESHPTIFLATHGRIVHQQCCDFLRSGGYQLMPIDGKDIAQSSELLGTYCHDS